MNTEHLKVGDVVYADDGLTRVFRAKVYEISLNGSITLEEAGFPPDCQMLHRYPPNDGWMYATLEEARDHLFDEMQKRFSEITEITRQIRNLYVYGHTEILLDAEGEKTDG